MRSQAQGHKQRARARWTIRNGIRWRRLGPHVSPAPLRSLLLASFMLATTHAGCALPAPSQADKTRGDTSCLHQNTPLIRLYHDDDSSDVVRNKESFGGCKILSSVRPRGFHTMPFKRLYFALWMHTLFGEITPLAPNQRQQSWPLPASDPSEQSAFPAYAPNAATHQLGNASVGRLRQVVGTTKGSTSTFWFRSESRSRLVNVPETAQREVRSFGEIRGYALHPTKAEAEWRTFVQITRGTKSLLVKVLRPFFIYTNSSAEVLQRYIANHQLFADNGSEVQQWLSSLPESAENTPSCFFVTEGFEATFVPSNRVWSNRYHSALVPTNESDWIHSFRDALPYLSLDHQSLYTTTRDAIADKNSDRDRLSNLSNQNFVPVELKPMNLFGEGWTSLTVTLVRGGILPEPRVF